MTALKDDQPAHIHADQIDGLIAAAGIDGAKDIMEAFWRSTSDLLKALTAQAAEGDFTHLAQTAHAIKGSAANVGALRLAHTAMAIERSMRDEEAATLASLVAKIRDEYEAARRVFDDHLNKANGAGF